jgi:hypothetical protein
VISSTTAAGLVLCLDVIDDDPRSFGGELHRHRFADPA